MLLREDGDLSVVTDAPAFPPGWGYEGLDADGDLPPPLCPGVLLDPEGLATWEALGLRALGDEESSPERCVAVLEEAARESRRWRPGRTALADAIASAFRSASGREPEARSSAARLTVRRAVAECAPPDWRAGTPLPAPEAFQRLVRPGWSRYGRGVRRYLAARFFASWSFQLGAGLSTHAASVSAALDVLWVEAARACELRARELDDESFLEALRRSDRLLVHLASPDRLAALFSRAEA